MEIRINKQSEVPVRQQLAEQIVLLIAAENLKPGEALPSVRELARRLRIHHNTVSHAYAELVRRTWLVRRRGSHLVVRAPDELNRLAHAQDLDDLFNATLRVARERGYSLQEIREHLRKRLLAQAPDHVLVVEQEEGLRQLLREEIRERLRWPVESCSRDDLAQKRGLVIGALVVTPQYAIADVDPLLSKDRPAVPIAFCGADEHVERIRKLRESCVVAVVSVSQAFITTARSLLASASGRRHTLCEYLFPLESPSVLRSADMVICDSIAFRQLNGPKSVHYPLVSPQSLEYLSSAMKSFAPA